MKKKLTAIAFTILSLINTQRLNAQMSNCEKANDIFIEDTHECIYCPTTFSVGKGAPTLTCAFGGQCTYGTNVHLHAKALCMYCSKDYTYDDAQKQCIKGRSKR